MRPKLPRFDLLAGRFARRVVERRSTPRNAVLEVVDAGGRRLLNARSVNYSFGSLQRVFEDAFALLRVEDRPLRSALVLGFGAGCVAEILRRRCGFDGRILGVEVDPVVVELWRRHFARDPDPRLEVIVADAADHLAAARELHDLVVVDAFEDDEIPERLQTPAFLRAAAAALAPGGLLVWNRLAHTEVAREASRRFARAFEAELGSARVLEVRGNLVLAHERPGSASG